MKVYTYLTYYIIVYSIVLVTVRLLQYALSHSPRSVIFFLQTLYDQTERNLYARTLIMYYNNKRVYIIIIIIFIIIAMEMTVCSPFVLINVYMRANEYLW